MFKWFKRKAAEVPADKSPDPAPMAAVAPAIAPAAPMIASVRPPAAVETINAANVTPAADTATVATSSEKPALRGARKALGSKPLKPTVGMRARKVVGKASRPMAIVAVQAGGRKVVAKAADDPCAYAFTLRADMSFRLAGAPDGAGPKLMLEGPAGGVRPRR